MNWQRHSRWARVCPVGANDIVELRINGRTTKPMRAGAVNWDNTARAHMSRIKEYRVVQQKGPSHGV